jgi:Na+-transporting methylmalonyl-CoA/oxaloacetate decarboxylase gamma subunit
MSFNVLQFFALAVRDNGTFTAFSGDAWQYAGEMTLLGMGMIFSVLGLLWGVLSIFKLVFVGKTAKTPKAPKEAKASKAPKAEKSVPMSTDEDATSAVSAASIPTQEADSDTALIAVLTAAVAAYRADEGSREGFRVVSFKRASGRAWNAKK